MTWLIPLVMLLFFSALWLFLRTSPGDLAHFLRTFVAISSAMATSGLLLFGRYGLAIIAIAATYLSVRSLIKRQRGADAMTDDGPKTSDIETDLVAMVLDRVTGAVEGRIKDGPLKGRSFSDLDEHEWPRFLEFARNCDPRSVALIETYLDRYVSGWRDWDEHGGGHNEGSSSEMTEVRALRILGLGPKAGMADILQAHRRLMKEAHPDHGGSDARAREINQARDFLQKLARYQHS